MQVDTLCHRIPGFIEKGVKAGIDKVFVGMENINPDNLAAVKKIAEPDARIPRDVPRVEEAPGRHHRRLHHRLPERHAGIDPAPPVLGHDRPVGVVRSLVGTAQV